MLSDYSTWGTTVNTIIEAMEKRDVWALFDHPHTTTYYGLNPRVILAGDAAHACVPHQGSGAGMCLEDSYILSRLIGEAKTAQDLDAAFKAFDGVRRPRTQRLVRTSREAGLLYEFELEGDDLEAIERNFKVRMNWIWNVDLQQELENALSIMRG